ncbi:MAG: hypothetical protein HQL71_02545 [Magnetococcales bacterium]|nr:hypothetical protein [Magnetococcales bacterium]
MVDKGAIGIVLFIMLFAPGIVGQLIYVVPIMVYFALKKRYQVLKGVLTGAIVTGFLNVGFMLIAAYLTVISSPDTSSAAYEKSHPILSEDKTGLKKHLENK